MCRGQSLQKLLRLNATPEDGEVKSFIDELLEKPPIILKDFVSSIELDPKNAYSLYLAILEAVRTGKYSHCFCLFLYRLYVVFCCISKLLRIHPH